MRYVALLLLLACSQALPPLQVQSGDKTSAVQLSDVHRDAYQTVRVKDPNSGKVVSYDAIELGALLSTFAANWPESEHLLFHCADGYLAEVPIPAVQKHQGFLAYNLPGSDFSFQPPAAPEPVSLGPYYLIWSSGDKSLPWPYQVTRIQIGSHAMPRLVDPPWPVASGEKLFRTKCLACHSLAGAGGSVGPELLRPVGVTRYIKREYLARWIANPASIRSGARMPAFGQELSGKEIEQLIDYLEHLDRNPDV